MEQKAKWVYIGEVHNDFTKGRFYSEDYTDIHEMKVLKKAVELFGCKVFRGDKGERVLLTKSFWQLNFYRL